MKKDFDDKYINTIISSAILMGFIKSKNHIAYSKLHDVYRLNNIVLTIYENSIAIHTFGLPASLKYISNVQDVIEYLK